MEDELLSTVEASEYLGVSVSWLKQARVNGLWDSPDCIRLFQRRGVVYKKSSLDAWVARKPTGRTNMVV